MSQNLERIVHKTLEKNVEMRYQHIDDLMADLRNERDLASDRQKEATTQIIQKKDINEGVRKLAAIMFADIVGFSQMMGKDEEQTLKLLEDYGYEGSRHFDAHALRTEDYDGVKDFARGCMRTYLILKEKVEAFNRDNEIQELLAEIYAEDENMNSYLGAYNSDKAAALKTHIFDRQKLGKRGLKYERLDQLTVELLLGVR